ncbi:MAG: virulence factor [Pseudomonadota bacterium]
MSKLNILCWQEIPSVVEAKDDSGTHKVQLSQKFQELIDLIAMRRGLAGTDSYLMEWGKEAQPDREEDAKTAAENLAAEIEARYQEIKADALAKT